MGNDINYSFRVRLRVIPHRIVRLDCVKTVRYLDVREQDPRAPDVFVCFDIKMHGIKYVLLKTNMLHYH